MMNKSKKKRFETFKQQRFECLSSRQRFQQLLEVNSGDFSGCIPDWINTVCWPPLDDPYHNETRITQIGIRLNQSCGFDDLDQEFASGKLYALCDKNEWKLEYNCSLSPIQSDVWISIITLIAQFGYRK